MPRTSTPILVRPLASGDGHGLPQEEALPAWLATVDNDIVGHGLVEDLAVSPGHWCVKLDTRRDDVRSKVGKVLGRNRCPDSILFIVKR